MDKQSTFVFLTYYATEFYYVTRSLHANMAKELEITKKFRKNSRDMSCYSPLEICIEVERKRHKALRKKHKPNIKIGSNIILIIAPVNCVVIDKSVLPVDCNNLSNDT